MYSYIIIILLFKQAIMSTNEYSLKICNKWYYLYKIKLTKLNLFSKSKNDNVIFKVLKVHGKLL